MPRSYRFENAKKKVSEMPSKGEPQPLHYGKQHAETEKLLRARKASPPKPDADRVVSTPPAEAIAPVPVPAATLERSVERPIESRPISDGGWPEHERSLPPKKLVDVVEEAQRQISTLSRASREFANAGLQIARLPLELAQLAVRRVMPEKT